MGNGEDNDLHPTAYICISPRPVNHPILELTRVFHWEEKIQQNRHSFQHLLLWVKFFIL